MVEDPIHQKQGLNIILYDMSKKLQNIKIILIITNNIVIISYEL